MSRKDVGMLMTLHNKGHCLFDSDQPITSAHLDAYTYSSLGTMTLMFKNT